MSLSKDLVAKFVKVTNDRTKPKTETTLYGAITEYAGEKYVKLDGSDTLTPVSSMDSTVGLTGIKEGDRVMVMIKNHTAVITGNTSSPSVNVKDLNDATGGVPDEITRIEKLVADKATIGELHAVAGRVNTLESDFITVNGTLNAQSATINEIESAHVTISNTLTAHKAVIDNLDTTYLKADTAKITYASIEKLESIEGDFHTLESTYASFSKTTTDDLTAVKGTINKLDSTYANLDFSNIGEAAIKKFYSTSGIIKNLTVSNGVYTGELAGVKISGDLITANTLVADKLVIKGTNGLYYKLNTDGVKTEAEQTEYNSLNGKVILAKSITAEKISVTDLVAFGATIGGFHLTDTSLYSGAKSSIDNTTRGSYLDTDGQVVFGDTNRFVKYYKDGSAYKLSLAADDISLSGNSLSTTIGTLTNGMTTVEQTADELTARLDTVESYDISGRNLIANTAFGAANDHKMYSTTGTLTRTADGLKVTSRSDTSRNGFVLPLVADGCLENGQKYTLSFEYRTNLAATGSVYVLQRTTPNVKVSDGAALVSSETEWKTFKLTFSSNDINARVCYAILIPYMIGSGNWIEIRNRTLKLEKGTVATDWCSAHEDASLAAKTATNYLGFSSSGLVVGDMTASALGKNVLIDSEAVKVRTGSAVNAVFGADIIELAKDNESATISMLKGAFKIYYDADNSDGGFGVYGMTSSGKERLAFQPVNENDNLTLGWGGYADKANSTNLYGHKMYLTTNEDIILNPGSGKIQMDGNVVLTNGRNLFGTNTAGAMRSMALWSSDDQILFGYGSYVNNEGIVYYNGNNIYIRSKNDIRMVTAHETVMLQDGDGSDTYNAFFKPTSNGKCTLGASANRWYAVYAANATIQTSDFREKENFVSLDDRHSKLFDKLRPVQYNFINGNGRLCYGLVAQDVLSAMEELGIGEHELDLVHHDTWFDKESRTTKDSFGLAYANLIAMLIHEVQKLKRERGHNYA